MKKAIIVDIDGTFSNNDHRQHLVQGEKKDWKAFSELCVRDSINGWCYDLVNAMIDGGFEILYVSGREERYRDVTEKFIDYYTGFSSNLFMRQNEDFRADTIIKEEIYRKYIDGQYEVIFCIDDRPSVCRMWR